MEVEGLPPVASPPQNPFGQVRFLPLIGYLAAALAVALVFFGTLHGVGILHIDDPVATVGINDFTIHGSLVAWCWMEARRNKISLLKLFRRTPTSFSWKRIPFLLLPLLLAEIGLILVLYAVAMYLAPEATSRLMHSSDKVDFGTDTAYPTAFFVETAVGLLILAPLVEEIFFRGFVLNSLAIRHRLGSAIFGSAAIFGIGHGIKCICLFLAGLVLSVTYVNTRTIRVPVCLHFFNNFLAFTAFCAVFLLNVGSEVDPSPQNPAYTLLVGIPCLLIGGVWLAIVLCRYWPAPGTLPPYFEEAAVDRVDEAAYRHAVEK